MPGIRGNARSQELRTLESSTVSLRYPFVLFDLDGTLVDSADSLVASVQYALATVDQREPPDRDTILIQVGKPLELILAELGYPAEPNQAKAFANVFRQHYAAHGLKVQRPYPGARELLACLKTIGAKLAIVTTKHQTQAEESASAAGIDCYFDYIHGWAEGRKHKPDPEPFLSALERLGGRSADALVVGDTEQDIIAARAAGITSCAVTHGFRPVALLAMYRPDYMVSHLRDVEAIVVEQR